MKKKVLFLIESLSGGGAEKVLVTLLNNIDKTRFDVTLCTVVDVGCHKNKLDKDIAYKPIIKTNAGIIGKLWYRVKYSLIYRILPLRLVYSFFVPKEHDVEVAFVEGFSTKLLSHSNNKESKKIAWVHIDLVNNHWIKSVYRNQQEELKSYSKFDYILGVSNTVSDSVKKLYKLNNVSTIYNPIDSNQIYTAGKAGNKTHAANARIKMISTGRLVPQKGYDRLLRIVKRLLDELIDVELTILGEGPDRNELQKYINENKLENRVFLPGFVENPFLLMAESSLFVCSSRSEGYSTAVTEALILEIPVVTTNCSGMDELLNHGEFGIITDNNENALYTALRDLLLSEEKLTHYKQKAVERSKDFDLHKLMQPIENLLAE